ncbi:MAG TPA: FHA domain-containing protein, partial [Myxococcota bacterium]|nr:FHA domain-containing protein [Myxococcota bacterium]
MAAEEDANRSTLRARGRPPPETPPPLVVTFYDGSGVRAVPLAPGESFTVGRGPTTADVVLADRSVSTMHARFERDGELLYVSDLGSLNGVRTRRPPCDIKGRTLVGTAVQIWLGDVCAVAHRLADVRDWTGGPRPDEETAGEPGPGGARPERRGAPTPLAHDWFLRELEAEVDRAALFERRFALLLVAAVDRDDGHMSRWERRLRALMRRVEKTGLYAGHVLEVLLPEADEKAAIALARASISSAPDDEPPLRFGIAVFPRSGTSAESLLAAAAAAVTKPAGSPIELAPPRDGTAPRPAPDPAPPAAAEPDDAADNDDAADIHDDIDDDDETET